MVRRESLDHTQIRDEKQVLVGFDPVLRRSGQEGSYIKWGFEQQAFAVVCLGHERCSFFL